MPDDKLTLDNVASLAEQSEVSIRDRLISATKGREDLLDVGTSVRAGDAIGTYRVRLKLWRDDHLPTMTGFPEFVAALEQAGEASVAMAVYEEPSRRRRFILLFDADLSRLLGAVELATGTERATQADESSALVL